MNFYGKIKHYLGVSALIFISIFILILGFKMGMDCKTKEMKDSLCILELCNDNPEVFNVVNWNGDTICPVYGSGIVMRNSNFQKFYCINCGLTFEMKAIPESVNTCPFCGSKHIYSRGE